MTDPSLIDEHTLARSEVVANSSMNRSRGLSGPNSYARDLHFDVAGFLLKRLRERGSVAWLDLCCGSGRALIEAGQTLPAPFGESAEILGVDLVPAFNPIPPAVAGVRLIAASFATWRPDRTYDLITCVHGLHYVGDKLGLIARAVSWLAEEGQLLAHLDPANLRFTDPDRPAGPTVLKMLRAQGLAFEPRKRLLSCFRPRELRVPFQYLGADDGAGPNYTGQPAVHSFYR